MRSFLNSVTNLTLLLNENEYSENLLNNNSLSNITDELLLNSYTNTNNIKEIKNDKIFVMEYINYHTIIFGTKFLKLYKYDILTNKITLLKSYEPELETIGIKTLKYDNNRLFCGIDKNLYIYNTDEKEELEEIKNFQAHENWISKIDILNDKLITSSKDRTLKLWSLNNLEEKEIYKTNNYFRNFYINKNKNSIFGLEINGKLLEIDIEKGKKIKDKSLYGNECVGLNGNNEMLISGMDNKIIITDINNNQIKKFTNLHYIRTIEWFNDNIFSCGGVNNNLIFIDKRKMEIMKTVSLEKINIEYHEELRELIEEFGISDQVEEMLRKNTIYDHKYNLHKQLIVGGGALTANINGGGYLNYLW